MTVEAILGLAVRVNIFGAGIGVGNRTSEQVRQMGKALACVDAVVRAHGSSFDDGGMSLLVHIARNEDLFPRPCRTRACARRDPADSRRRPSARAVRRPASFICATTGHAQATQPTVEVRDAIVAFEHSVYTAQIRRHLHDVPQHAAAGNHSIPMPLDIGLADASRRTPHLPLYNGSTPDLPAVVNFYNERFNIGFTEQEQRDLVAFLRTL